MNRLLLSIAAVAAIIVGAGSRSPAQAPPSPTPVCSGLIVTDQRGWTGCIQMNLQVASPAPTWTPLPPTPTPIVTAIPTSKPTLVPTPPPTPVPTPSGVALHMLDDTGCQDFAPNDQFNQTLVNAPVDPNSAAYIANAARFAPGGMTIAGAGSGYSWYYAVIPANQPAVTVNGSPHAINEDNTGYPANTMPVPASGAAMSQLGGDNNLLLVQLPGVNGNPYCTDWEASATSPGPPWRAYSGGGLSMGGNTTGYICLGEQSSCGMVMASDLTTWEATHGATNPIRHVIHMESPNGFTCDSAPSGVACIPVGGRLRLHANYQCPSDPNANAVCVAQKTYGIDVGDNGGGWKVYVNTQCVFNGSSCTPQSVVPGPVLTLFSNERVTDFDVVRPSYHCVGQQCGYTGAGKSFGSYPP